MCRQGILKQPQSRLGKLFSRSTKCTAETQTLETQEDETQTGENIEAETAAQPDPASIAADQSNPGQLGTELSFGDALKPQAAPAAHAQSSPRQAGVMLADLIEEHGPLAMSAMSSPVHTAPLEHGAEQHSPAHLAGCGQALQAVPAEQAWISAENTGQLQQASFATSMLPPDASEMTFQVMLHAAVALLP